MLLHAGVADLRMWNAQVDALVSRRMVVRCDLPGYGGTPVEPGADGCDAEDVLALLDELGVEGFALVGASYGGYVALQVASAVPDRVERLVLVDAAADLIEPDESLHEVWRQEQSLVEIGDLAGATDLMVDTWLGPDADDDHRALLRDMQRRAFDLQVAAGDEGANRDLPVDLARITASVTVVVGHHDLSFFRATARVLADGLPHADLVELAWAGHLPSLERPAETARGGHGPGMNLWPRTGSRLLVSLLLGPDLARLGPGARSVALIAAAHVDRVALIWPARAGRRQGQERLKKGLSNSKQRCPPGSITAVDRVSED